MVDVVTPIIQSPAIAASSPYGTFLTTTIWVAIGTSIAAFIAGSISRHIKISEFRQGWINDLRNDIAEYISKTDEYLNLNERWEKSLEKEKIEIGERVDTLRYSTLTILRRVKLRFNPSEKNPNKLEDDVFLDNLSKLIDRKYLIQSSKTVREAWDEKSEEVLLQAREILKREWEVTKSYMGFIRPCFSRPPNLRIKK